jgi:hypothetical protein
MSPKAQFGACGRGKAHEATRYKCPRTLSICGVFNVPNVQKGEKFGVGKWSLKMVEWNTDKDWMLILELFYSQMIKF